MDSQVVLVELSAAISRCAPAKMFAEADAHREALDYLMLDSGAKGTTGETQCGSAARRGCRLLAHSDNSCADSAAQAIAAWCRFIHP